MLIPAAAERPKRMTLNKITIAKNSGCRGLHIIAFNFICYFLRNIARVLVFRKKLVLEVFKFKAIKIEK